MYWKLWLVVVVENARERPGEMARFCGSLSYYQLGRLASSILPTQLVTVCEAVLSREQMGGRTSALGVTHVSPDPFVCARHACGPVGLT
jgi:hypothetical protein